MEDESGARRRWDLDAEPDLGRLAPRRHGPVDGIVYAEFPVRAVAFGLDVLLLGLVTTVLVSPIADLVRPVFDAGGPLAAPGREVVLPYLVAFTVSAVAALVVFAYSIARLGASPGQLALGLFTLRAVSGTRLPATMALLRAVVLFAPGLLLTGFGPGLAQLIHQLGLYSDDVAPILVTLALRYGALVWYVLLAASALADPRGRGWHDRISGSSVVRRAGSIS